MVQTLTKIQKQNVINNWDVENVMQFAVETKKMTQSTYIYQKVSVVKF